MLLSWYKGSTFLLYILLSLLLLALPVSLRAMSVEPSFYDIPSLPLSQGLIELALQSDVEIIAKQSDLSEYRSPSIFGFFEFDKALQELLSKSLLSYTFLEDENVYIVLSQPKIIQNAPNQESTEYKDFLEEIVVTGSSFPFRYQTIVNSTNQNGVSLFDSVRFHNVVPGNLLRDQSASSISDTLRYTSGAIKSDGLLDTNDDYIIRGFLRNNLYMDGFRLSDNTAARIMPENVQRIDILKGPSMLFYGQSSPGGVVDVLRKKPTDERSIQTTLRGGGSYDHKRVALEINTGETQFTNTKSRFSAVSDYSSDRLNSSKSNRHVFSLSTRTQVPSSFVVDLGYEYQRLEKDFYRNYPVLLDSEYSLSETVRDLLPQYDDRYSADIDLVNMSFEFYLNDQWRFFTSTLLQKEKRYGVRVVPDFFLKTEVLVSRPTAINRVTLSSIAGLVAAPINRQFSQAQYELVFGDVNALYDQRESERDIAFNFSVNGQFYTGEMEHRLNVGGDFYQQKLYQNYIVNTFQVASPVKSVDLSLAQIQLVDILKAFRQDGLFGASLAEKKYYSQRRDLGLYMQLYTNFTEDLSTSIGGRYSGFSGTQLRAESETDTLKADITDLSFQIGTSYRIHDGLSLFTNYSEAVTVRYLLDDFDSHAKGPEVSEQWESGFKWLGLNGKVVSTVAFFDITNEQLYGVELISGYRTLKGPFSQKSKGIDCDFTLNLNNKMDLIWSFSLSNNSIFYEGEQRSPPKLVADSIYSLFARYISDSQWVSSIGAYQVSDRSLDTNERRKLNGYTVFDLTFSRYFQILGEDLGIKFIFNNVFDKEYEIFAAPGVRVNSAEGRALQFQISLKLG